jgi:hypothetical protein
LSANVASAHLLAAVPRGQPRTGVYSLIVAIDLGANRAGGDRW